MNVMRTTQLVELGGTPPVIPNLLGRLATGTPGPKQNFMRGLMGAEEHLLAVRAAHLKGLDPELVHEHFDLAAQFFATGRLWPSNRELQQGIYFTRQGVTGGARAQAEHGFNLMTFARHAMTGGAQEARLLPRYQQLAPVGLLVESINSIRLAALDVVTADPARASRVVHRMPVLTNGY